MSTDAHAPLLDRSVSKAAAAESITGATAPPREMVNYGTQLFASANASANKAYTRLREKDPNLPTVTMGDFHLPLTLLFLHALELADAIEVLLLAESVVTPAELQLRALFEAVIQLEWLLREETARRAFAYQLFDMRDRLRFYRGEIPTSDEGKKREKAFADDTWTGAMKRPHMAIQQPRSAGSKAFCSNQDTKRRLRNTRECQA